jgi:DNA-directed RNA polymerase specialized sigma24 family protein
MSFGCNKDTAEDLVQEMYLKLYDLTQKGVNIKYNNTVNYYYIYKILRSFFIDLKRKESKINIVDIDAIHIHNLNVANIYFNEGSPVEMFDVTFYNELYDKLMSVLDSLYWYDRKVFELLDGETSVSELSRNTGISYYSLYNTYKKVKQIIKDELL